MSELLPGERRMYLEAILGSVAGIFTLQQPAEGIAPDTTKQLLIGVPLPVRQELLGPDGYDAERPVLIKAEDATRALRIHGKPERADYLDAYVYQGDSIGRSVIACAVHEGTYVPLKPLESDDD